MATITTAGAVPSSPTALREELIAAATALSPGLTANLPGSLIEDLASTATGALVVQDQAYVDLINSISPTTANDFILTQLGNVYGVQQGVGSNTSVYVVFTGTVGFVINIGFIVTDGTYQYTVQDSSIIQSGGTSSPVYCLATTSGSWAVPANSVNGLGTSVPAGITLSVNNPNAGLPGATAQSVAEYRLQVIQAGRAVATGLPTLLKTALQKVTGVQSRLISIRAVSTDWQIIVGGGDPYAVANAIYQSMFNILNLVGASSGGTTETITINDYPDTYNITFVVPLQQAITITVNWATAAGTNFVSNTVVTSAIQGPLQAYINSIHIGAPISELELYSVFLAATAGVIDPSTIVKLTFAVYINTTLTPWPSGEVTIFGNPEGYFYAALPTSITVTNIP
jgi:hypothetical protein